jgi:ABC-type molybdate transport system substrate-binding protein
MPSPQTTTPRSGPVLMLFGGIVALTLVLGLVAMFHVESGRDKGSQPLLVHCAASLKAAVTAIATEYERETGRRVELSFGGSQTLLTNITNSKRGDLFLPADDTYIAAAREKGLIDAIFPLALEGEKVKVAVAVLKCSTQREAAEKLARYIAAPEKGLRRFQTNAFQIPSVQP